MKIIDRYILYRLFLITFYVLIAFFVLYAVYDLLAESGNIGKENYTISTLFHYVFLRIPIYIYDIFPIASLVGAVITMNRFADNSEYVIMRSYGTTIKRIITILSVFALSCAMINLSIGEFLITPSYLSSNMVKHNAQKSTNTIVSKNDLANKKELWLKSGEYIVRIDDMLPDNTLLGIVRYSIDNNNFMLKQISTAKSATYIENGVWKLNDYQETVLEDNKTNFRQLETELWHSQITPDILGVLIIEPNQMSINALKDYVKYLKQNKQRTKSYEIARWHKIFYPFIAIPMALIALAFTPIISRGNNMGLRIFLAICLGVSFSFVVRFFNSYAELFNIKPFVAGFAPIIIFSCIAIAGVIYTNKQ